jgi:hypothetical protein
MRGSVARFVLHVVCESSRCERRSTEFGPDQQSSGAAATRQISPSRTSSSRPGRRVSIAMGNGWRFSKLATDSTGSPSPAPTGSSLGTTTSPMVRHRSTRWPGPSRVAGRSPRRGHVSERVDHPAGASASSSPARTTSERLGYRPSSTSRSPLRSSSSLTAICTVIQEVCRRPVVVASRSAVGVKDGYRLDVTPLAFYSVTRERRWSNTCQTIHTGPWRWLAARPTGWTAWRISANPR